MCVQRGQGDETCCRLSWPCCMLNDSETEDFLKSILGPLEDEEEEDPRVLQSWSPQDSDSGISEDHPFSGEVAPSPPSPHSCVIVHCDHNYSSLHPPGEEVTLQSVRTEAPEVDFSIDLADWDSEFIVEPPCEDQDSDSLISLPMEDFADHPSMENQSLLLTEEECRLLTKEGVTLPTHLPLTRSEERTLKRIRRKIRNKHSAQQSRKKKKEYVDGLESRVAACTAQNQVLQKKVQQLQNQNMSLLQQLRKLQALVRQTSSKTTTTSTCIMVFLLSFCLILFPSINPLKTKGAPYEDPRGVISRKLRGMSPLALGNEQPIEKVIGNLGFTLDSEPDLMEPRLLGNQNHTPEAQSVSEADSGSALNGNSSSDSQPPAAELAVDAAVQPPPPPPPSGVARQRGHASGAHAAEYAMDSAAAAKREDWRERPTTVIIQQHHSDEM
ncbi:cAMP responsive element binding protein 3-like 3 like isoform X2 [Latimeria chalumnae]|uniref:cAMP responsive element binding protein 3-like 3 like isoform X2 n=1 Tax=Latimeria chalumnae TaxID=7897 RepID=UPI00313ECD0B